MSGHDDFDCQPVLRGKTISLRPIGESDFEEIYQCASDKRIWAGHPNPYRYRRSEFEQWFANALASRTCVVVSDNSNGKIIGSSRFYRLDSVPDDISIGFTFLACDYWGGATNLELKQLMLAHVFKHFDSVWFHVDASNLRSQKAMLNIGALYSHREMLNISAAKEPWFCYKIEKTQWQNRTSS